MSGFANPDPRGACFGRCSTSCASPFALSPPASRRYQLAPRAGWITSALRTKRTFTFLYDRLPCFPFVRPSTEAATQDDLREPPAMRALLAGTVSFCVAKARCPGETQAGRKLTAMPRIRCSVRNVRPGVRGSQTPTLFPPFLAQEMGPPEAFAETKKNGTSR